MLYEPMAVLEFPAIQAQREETLASNGCFSPVGRAMRGGCFAARMQYVRDAFAWELAVVALGNQCTSSAVHPAWSRNLLAGRLRRRGG